jgi:PAS domain S-box-containing protein
MTHPLPVPVLSRPTIPGYRIVEQLYQGSRTVVYRGIAIAQNRPVVIKMLRRDYPSSSELVRFRNQYAIAKRVPVAGVVQPLALEVVGHTYAIVMEDMGGLSLDAYCRNRTLALGEQLAIAVQLAGILHHLGQHRVVHKDIKPANILIHPETHQVTLIDFSLASLLPRETQPLQSPSALEGTLSYIAPEQTGRMNRGVDYRSDFYSLGVTLYELLTGTLPFVSEDPIDLIHRHLTQIPLPVHQVNPAIPPMVGAVVAKLMAKNAEHRYQSALGLNYDLQECVQQWESTGGITQFELGQWDVSDRFLIPDRLYGRKSEVKTLLASFERVALGASELMLVAGYSGIGKTAVVNEVHKPMTQRKGYFIKGKFDQFNRSSPFSAFVQALQDLVGQLLGESDRQLQVWNQQILGVLGENAQVMTNLVPALEQMIGVQPPVPELSQAAAQNRFNRLIQEFIQLFTTADHPLVIFLDDLQWADAASLDLIQVLMTQPQAGYLLLIGAYRDNEVFPAHPLMLLLDQIADHGAVAHTMTLPPLGLESLNPLIADTLHAPESIVQPLTALVQQKTQGNPFFVTQFLKALYQDQFITFNYAAGYWQCDITQVQGAALTDDIVAFMASRLQRLTPATQNSLKFAACIGAQFDLETLAIISERSPTAVAADLWQALQDGLILPQHEIYKFYVGSPETRFTRPRDIVHFQFLHDRIQQAAYSLIPDHQKQDTHYRIGRLLQQNLSEAAQDDKQFDIVGHFNLGRALIASAQEREAIARLNLQASNRAKRSTAYSMAKHLAKQGIDLLEPDYWHHQYKLALDLHVAMAEAAYLEADFETMDAVAQEVLQRARTVLDKVTIYGVQINALAAQQQIPAAIQLGQAALEQLGIQFSGNPDEATIETALQSLNAQLTDDSMELLAGLPPMDDARSLAAMNVLAMLITPAFVDSPQNLPLLGVALVSLSLQFGNAPASAVGYGISGMVLSNFLGEVDRGYRLGKLAVHLGQQETIREYQAVCLLSFGSFLQHQKEPFRDAHATLKSAYVVGLETGDVTSVGYSLVACCTQGFFAGVVLPDLEADLDRYCALARQVKQDQVLRFMTMQQQMMHGLMTPTVDPDRFRGPAYDETVMLPIHYHAHEFNELATVYIFKLVPAYLFGHYDRALGYIEEANQYLDSLVGLIEGVVFHLYAGLTYLAVHTDTSELAIAQTLERVTPHAQVLAYWTGHAPMNYQHKLDLLEAEQCRIQQKRYEAADLYDRAIAGARANGYVQEDALANELAARFYLAQGRDTIAAVYLQDAYYGYSRWGARAKAEALEERYSHLLHPVLRSPSPSHNLVSALTSIDSPRISVHSSASVDAVDCQFNQALDVSSVIKASQALSSTIQLDELLHQLTQILLQNSGGDRCALVLLSDLGEWRVAVKADLDRVDRCNTLLESDRQLPVRLIQYVKNTQDVLVIDDLEADLPIVDPYLEQQRPQSMLCLPLRYHGQVMGLVYVSNQSTRSVFTQERVSILNFLGTQAAISLQNAHLYQQSKNYAAQLEQSIAELTQLEAEQQRLIDVLEATPDYIGVANAAGEILWCNKPLRALHQTMAKRTHASECHPEWAREIIVNQAMPAAIAQGSWSGELALLDGANREIPVSQVIIAHKDPLGVVQYFSTIMRDITEVKRTEKSLKLTQFAIDKTAMGIFWIREDGYLLEVNEAACASLGYSHDQLQGRYVWDIDADMKPHEFSKYWEDLLQNVYVRFETRHQRKDGTIFPVEITSNYIEYEGQGFAFSQAQDISDRKAYEVGLEETNAELVRIARMKDEFLSTMSHELRTPLNAILGMAEGLQEEIFGDINPQQLNALATIEQSGMHLLSLINDILDLSRMTADKISLSLVPTDIARLCLDCLDVIRPQAQERQIQTQGICPEYLPLVLIDRQRIEQALLNVLSNAIKFTPDGGQVSLVVEQVDQPSDAGVPGHAAQGMLRIMVNDTGIGIAPEDRERIFQPFIQLDGALNRQYDGTGLGLALVQKIAELHGGRVQVESEIGVGSSFRLELPWRPDPSSAGSVLPALGGDAALDISSEGRDAMPHLLPPLVLLVEDDAANIMTISGYLAAKGYRLELADHGRAAIDRLQVLRPDIILMDIQMPVMDGLEAIQYIRQDLGLVDVLIIALTALAMQGDRDRCLRAGASEYLSKPVRLKQLDALIQRYI